MFPLFNFSTLENIIEKIKSVALERFKEPDLEKCFIVEINISGSKLDVFIDTDEGVKFFQCQKLSRAIEAYLDESLVLGEKYTIEVSSPGVERPLKFLRQYPRNIGRTLEIKLKSGDTISGVLKQLESNVLTIESKGKKKKEVLKKEIDFDAIESSKVLITFSNSKR